MDFFKVKSFRKARKPNSGKELDGKPVPQPEELKIENANGNGNGNGNENDLSKPENVDPTNETEEEDDDDDFILNEVKRRMKELRRNSFMVLIPEESCPEEEEEDETSSSGCRGSEVEDSQQWCNFDAEYATYCERMLFFDRMSAQRMQDAGTHVPLTPSPRSASKKLSFTLRSLSLKKKEEPQENGEQEYLQPQHDDPYQDLESAYVAQVCLTWEALHCQYTQLSQKISSDPDNITCYSHVAQLFQRFQVLLQRFVENEPFEQGLRAEVYARSRNSFTNLLQVPSIQDSGKKEKEGNEGDEEYEQEEDAPVLASHLLTVIEASILTFHLFLKMDKKKSGKILNLFGGQNQVGSHVQQIQSSLDKKMLKIKELCKKKKGWKKKTWPTTAEEIELFFGLIDIKVISRALRMIRISKEQLVWCEEKMNKLDVSESKLKRDGSPILFPS